MKVTDIRKSTPAMAVVGVTDLAVGALRSARAELSPAKIQADVQKLPVTAISTTIAVAARAEDAYGELAARGKSLVDSVRRRSATKDLLAQGRSTVTLGKAAVTTVRRAGDDTFGAARATLTAGRREARDLVGSVTREATSVAKTETAAAKPAAKKATKSTRSAAKRTTTTAKTRSANVKRATKATGTSARKTATKSARATKTAAKATGR